ncbi:MAG: MFS transporter [Thermoanaerobaculia bacterium]
MAVGPSDIGLLSNSRFRRLLESRLLGHTAQYATVYAIFILVVGEENSSFNAALLLTAGLVPSVLLGFPAGFLVDFAPRRLVLTLGYLARALIALMLLTTDLGLNELLMLAAASSVAGLFLGCAEPATVPALVPANRLPGANSLMILAHVIAQVIGLVALAPLLVKQVSVDAVFASSAVLFLGAAVITGAFARDFTPRVSRSTSVAGREIILEQVETFAYNRRAYLATAYLTITVVLSKVLVVVFPAYAEDVMGIAPEDIVFVAAPAAIGAGVGILLAPPLCRLGAFRIASVSFALSLLGILTLGFVAELRDVLESHLDLGIGFVEQEVGVSAVITVTMMLAIPIGLVLSVNNVASRVVLNQEMPQRSQARAFAIQSVMADLVALVPVLAIGLVADAIGAGTALFLATGAAIALSVYVTLLRRPRSAPQQPAAG